MDIEWLLSTLFDASLLSTFEPPAFGGSFFRRCRAKQRNIWARALSLCGNYVVKFDRCVYGQGGGFARDLRFTGRVTAPGW
jgi:hypothetical protein